MIPCYPIVSPGQSQEDNPTWLANRWFRLCMSKHLLHMAFVTRFLLFQKLNIDVNAGYFIDAQ